MKTLYESILDDEDDLMDKMSEDILIKGFLEANYIIKGTYDIIGNVVDVTGDIKLKQDSGLKHLTSGIFKFGVISKNFFCNCTDIIDLAGAPTEVKGSFDCSECHNLKSLEGSPKIVGRNFKCSECEKLTDLKGSPEKLTWLYGSFTCMNCTGLKTLEGCTKKINGSLNCAGCTNLTSLKGCPQKVNGLNFENCKNLKDLNGLPSKFSSLEFGGTPAHDEYVKNGHKLKIKFDLT